MSPAANNKRLRPLELVLLAAPLLWVVPAMLHPVGEPYAGIADEANMWIFVHVAPRIRRLATIDAQSLYSWGLRAVRA